MFAIGAMPLCNYMSVRVRLYKYMHITTVLGQRNAKVASQVELSEHQTLSKDVKVLGSTDVLGSNTLESYADLAALNIIYGVGELLYVYYMHTRIVNSSFLHILHHLQALPSLNHSITQA